MAEKKENIFTSYNEVVQKSDKERLLKQKATTIWLTGLSGSGKSTIARGLEQTLHNQGYAVMLLDGDNVRDGLNKNLGFSAEGRSENIRRIAEVNKLFNSCGVITINAFVSPSCEVRSMARDIISSACFNEVYVNTPLSVCESRDTKGLYKRARAGEIKDFTGISAPFEVPKDPDFTIFTETESIEQSVNRLVQFILPKIQLT